MIALFPGWDQTGGIRAFLLFCEDDAAAKSGVHSKGEHSVRELSCILPQLGEWELLLSAGNGEELIRQIFRYFDELIAHSQVDKNVLKSLRLDITQMVHSVLKERGRNAGEIFSNVEYDRRYQRALSSSAGMKRYLSFWSPLPAAPAPVGTCKICNRAGTGIYRRAPWRRDYLCLYGKTGISECGLSGTAV